MEYPFWPPMSEPPPFVDLGEASNKQVRAAFVKSTETRKRLKGLILDLVRDATQRFDPDGTPRGITTWEIRAALNLKVDPDFISSAAGSMVKAGLIHHNEQKLRKTGRSGKSAVLLLGPDPSGWRLPQGLKEPYAFVQEREQQILQEVSAAIADGAGTDKLMYLAGKREGIIEVQKFMYQMGVIGPKPKKPRKKKGAD